MRFIKVVIAGFRDGWTQPYELSTSTNVDADSEELLDRAISVGQLVRAGFRSQVWREGLWPVPASIRRRKAARRFRKDYS